MNINKWAQPKSIYQPQTPDIFFEKYIIIPDIFEFSTLNLSHSVSSFHDFKSDKSNEETSVKNLK